MERSFIFVAAQLAIAEVAPLVLGGFVEGRVLVLLQVHLEVQVVQVKLGSLLCEERVVSGGG